MGLFDAITGLFDPTSSDSSSGLLSTAGAFFSDVSASGVVPVNYFPTYAFNPDVYSTGGENSVAQPVMASVPAGVGAVTSAAAGIARVVQMIGFKMAQKLGLKGIPSLKRMLAMVRQLAKTGLAPAAVAAALGIGVDELATLITAQARKKRRRMNVANTKALRRSLRRMEGFDRLACRVKAQLGAMRGASHTSHRRSRCGTCRRSPCRCK